MKQPKMKWKRFDAFGQDKEYWIYAALKSNITFGSVTKRSGEKGYIGCFVIGSHSGYTVCPTAAEAKRYVEINIRVQFEQMEQEE